MQEGNPLVEPALSLLGSRGDGKADRAKAFASSGGAPRPMQEGECHGGRFLRVELLEQRSEARKTEIPIAGGVQGVPRSKQEKDAQQGRPRYGSVKPQAHDVR